MTMEAFNAAIDSQFSAAAQIGPIALESPLAALGLFSHQCQWNPQTRKVECGDIEWLSMEMLLRGQRSNPEVQEIYRNCRNNLPSRWDFWLLVVRSCGSRKANLDEAHIRIAGQALNDPDSLRSGRWALKALGFMSDPEGKKFFQILSMYYLLAGQRHNADTMQLYRACFRHEPEELFRRVETIAPIDLEDIVIEFESAKARSTTG